MRARLSSSPSRFQLALRGRCMTIAHESAGQLSGGAGRVVTESMSQALISSRERRTSRWSICPGNRSRLTHGSLPVA
jgi:hypothetical protein